MLYYLRLESCYLHHTHTAGHVLLSMSKRISNTPEASDTGGPAQGQGHMFVVRLSGFV